MQKSSPHDFPKFEDTHQWEVYRLKASANWCLPVDFPVIRDTVTGLIFEPGIHFLYDSFLKKNVGWVPVRTTLATYAHSLCDWLRFLAEFEFDWLKCGEEIPKKYVNTMGITISPFTGQLYAETTINQRLNTVYLFYQWAAASKLWARKDAGTLMFPPVGETERVKFERSQEDDDDDDVHNGANFEGAPVKVMSKAQVGEILEALGPDPFEWERSNGTDTIHFDSPTSRDMLCAETSLMVGLRISEVSRLNLRQFTVFRGKSISQTRTYRISVVGKGNKRRVVRVPGYLIERILKYIDGERAMILKKLNLAVEPLQVFINPLSSRRFAGMPVSVRTLERSISKACIKTNNFYTRERTDFSVDEVGTMIGSKRLVNEPNFVFHNLRHTYTVWTYFVRLRSGDKMPWVFLQIQLGHSKLETTMKFYMTATQDYEGEISDNFMGSIK